MEGGRGAALGLTASAPQMPVCSYFLKGVCSNSNCPYSHVYVSRKAEVCTDFLRGYCPLGAKVRGLGWGAPGPGPPCLGGLSSPPALAPLLRGRPHPPWAAGPGARGGAPHQPRGLSTPRCLLVHRPRVLVSDHPASGPVAALGAQAGP